MTQPNPTTPVPVPTVLEEMEPDLTFDFIVARFQAVFPGARLEIGTQVGGRQLRFWVWQFLIEVSFCETKVAVVDEVGTARVTFKFQPDSHKGQPLFTKTAVVRKPSGLQQFIGWSLAYLNGVTAAIEQSMEAGASEIADIFSGSDSR